MLKHLINGSMEYADLVNPVIRDAHELSTGAKNYFNIDRDAYPIVVHLILKDSEFFNSLNVDDLTTDNYQSISSLLEEQRDLEIA